MQTHFIESKLTYIKLKSNVCFPVQCHADCLSCSGTPDRCESCRDPKALLHLGHCLSVCPAGYYAEGRVCAGMTLTFTPQTKAFADNLAKTLAMGFSQEKTGIPGRLHYLCWPSGSSAEAPCGQHTTIRLGVSHLNNTYSGSVLSAEYQVSSTFWI